MPQGNRRALPGWVNPEVARFCLIVSAAAFVRAWGLGRQSLTLDESVALRMALRPVGLILCDNTDNTPPLYYLLLHASVWALGRSEAALRALSAAAGVLSVALTGWSGRMLGGPRLAEAAMVLLALLPMPTIYSQTARSYALFLAASTASFAAVLACERRPRPGRAAAYVASTLAMCYTHNYWVFNAAAQQAYLAWAFLRRRVSPRLWAGMCAGVLVGYVPLAGWLARRTAAVRSQSFWLPPATPDGLLSALRSHVIFGLPGIAALPYLALLCLGAAAPWLSRKKSASDGPGWTLVILWAACPLLLPYAYSRLAAPILWPRYTIAASPAICLLMARGALALPRALPAAAVASLSLLSAMSLSRARASSQEDWRSAVARLGELSSEQDVIVPCPFYVQDPLRYYYRGKAAIVPLRLAPDIETAPPDDIDGALAGRRRAWLLMRVEARHRGRRLLPDILRQRTGAKMTYVEDFGQGVYLTGFDLSP